MDALYRSIFARGVFGLVIFLMALILFVRLIPEALNGQQQQQHQQQSQGWCPPCPVQKARDIAKNQPLTHGIRNDMDDENKYANGYTDLENEDFLQYIRHKWVQAPSNRPVSLGDYKGAAAGNMSQAGQSLYVDKLLKQKKNGFYIECGAASGENLSNSIFFELSRNWNGLLIEASPRWTESIIKKRRNAYFMNIALSPGNATQVLKFNPRKLTGSITNNNNNAKTTVDVQSLPMRSILLALGVQRVDYFSLDVEGLELDILRTLPYDIVYFDVFTIEVFKKWPAQTLQKIEHIRNFFQMMGTHKEVGIIGNNLDIVFQHV